MLHSCGQGAAVRAAVCAGRAAVRAAVCPQCFAVRAAVRAAGAAVWAAGAAVWAAGGRSVPAVYVDVLRAPAGIGVLCHTSYIVLTSYKTNIN